MRQFATLLITLAVALRPASAADWPCVRGPTHNAVSAEVDLDSSWPADGPTVVWSRRLGQGYSAFAVAGGRAVTHYQTAFGQYILCLDADTGETIWEYRVGLPYDAVGIYPGPRSTPAIAGDRVYFVTPDTLLGCLSLTTGELIWDADLKQRFAGEGTDFGYSASPLVIDDRVILPIGGENTSVVSIDANTGATVWSTGSHPASYCTTTPIELDGRTLLVNYLQNDLTIVDAETGRLLWESHISEGYDEHAAAPLWSPPMLITSAPFRAGATGYKLAIEPGEGDEAFRLDVQLTWQSPKFSNDTASSVLIDGAIYGFDLRDQQAKAHRPSRGTFRCLDASTGDVLWSDATVGHATVLAADGKLILFADTGELVLAVADPTAYRELGRTSLFEGEICWTPPALSDGRVFVRSPSLAACIQLRSNNGAATTPGQTKSVAIPTRSKFGFHWLVRGEREHPFMLPPVEDVLRWFIAGLITAVIPALFVATVWRRRDDGLVDINAFAVTAGLLGLAATPMLNQTRDDFWLTFPVTIFAALIAAVFAAERLRQTPDSRPARRASRAAGVSLVLVCLGYFYVLHEQSLPHEWVFLLGLVPAAPAAAYVARRASGAPRRLSTWIAIPILYSLFFWAGPAFQWLRRTTFAALLHDA